MLLGGTNSVESKSNTWPHLIRPSIRNFSMLHRFRRGYSCVYEFCKHSSIPWRTSGDTCHVSRSEISVYLQECTRIHEELRGRRRGGGEGMYGRYRAWNSSKQLRSWTCTVSKKRKEKSSPYGCELILEWNEIVFLFWWLIKEIFWGILQLAFSHAERPFRHFSLFRTFF